jgi:hypothetical protein
MIFTLSKWLAGRPAPKVKYRFGIMLVNDHKSAIQETHRNMQGIPPEPVVSKVPGREMTKRERQDVFLRLTMLSKNGILPHGALAQSSPSRARQSLTCGNGRAKLVTKLARQSSYPRNFGQVDALCITRRIVSSIYRKFF